MAEVDAYLFRKNIAGFVTASVASGATSPRGGLVALAKGLEFADKGEIAKVNKAIVKEMLHYTRLSVSDIERNGSKPYRKGPRDVGGIGRAVRNSKFGTADETGIFFADQSILNKEARHWRRLNFGTVGRSTKPRVFKLAFDGQAQEFGFNDSPRPGFVMPAGYFLHGSASLFPPLSKYKGANTLNPFVPLPAIGSRPVPPGSDIGTTVSGKRQRRLLGTSVTPDQRRAYESARKAWRRNKLKRNEGGGDTRPRKSVGIKSRHFLDAGLAALEREFPKQYEQFIETEVENAVKAKVQQTIRTRQPSTPKIPIPRDWRTQPRGASGRFLPGRLPPPPGRYFN